MSPKQPSLDEGGHSVNTRHGDVRWRLGAEHDRSLMSLPFIPQTSIGSGPVGMHGGTYLDDIFHKWDDLTFGGISNATQTDSTKSFGLQHLDSNDNKGLGYIGVTAFCSGRNGFVTDSDLSLINLHKPSEQVSARANHGTTKAMQHGPRCLVTSQSQHAL